MLQRYRLIVPFGEITNDECGIDGGVWPFGTGARTLVGFEDIADHDVNRHTVAPGVVHRHGGVLQTDGAFEKIAPPDSGLITGCVGHTTNSMNPIMEREICWWIPRLQLGERGAASWQDGGERSSWR